MAEVNEIRIPVSENSPSKVPKKLDYGRYLNEHPVVNGRKILVKTTPQGPVETEFGNGFVSAAFHAYSTHHELIVSPTDVWLAIVAAAANFIDYHGEKYRSLFVEHEDQLTLEAGAGGTITYESIWPGLIKQLADGIDKHLKNDTVSIIVPNFSDTTEQDVLIGKIMLMGAMQKYFKYECYLECGLPAVIMRGTVEDWELVKKKFFQLAFIREFEDWLRYLTFIVDQFIGSMQDPKNVDKSFWNAVCNRIPGGSGPSYLSGWILAFTPFIDGKYVLPTFDKVLEEHWTKSYPWWSEEEKKKFVPEKYHKWGEIQTGHIPTSCVEVPVYVNDNGREYNTKMYAGAIVNSYDPERNQMKPSFDWLLIDVTE